MRLDVAQGQHRLPRYATAPMTDALNWLRLGLSGTALVFLAVMGRSLAGDPGQSLPSARQTGVGFFTNFFDTLGIGSFAPTTALFRLMRMVDDRLIPGTLNVGHAIPTIAQALIYMILVSLLGMSPTAAFPIMMGSCAFLMPVGGLRFVREGSYDSRTSVGLTLGGIPGVLLAAYFVVSMSLYAVRWLVIAVVIYTSIQMLWQRPKSK